jgi:hypothetical protein
MDMLPLHDNSVGLQTYMEVPNELNIFMRTEASFLPPGKTWNDLTPEERQEVELKYRFSSFVPGMYQTITGFGDSI